MCVKSPIILPSICHCSKIQIKIVIDIVIIAQSHIAFHYNIKEKIILADLFSCAPFNYDEVESLFKELGTIKSNVLVPRGTKHIYRVNSKITDDELKASTLWQKNIGITR